jgi:integrase/recombinase XerD
MFQKPLRRALVDQRRRAYDLRIILGDFARSLRDRGYAVSSVLLYAGAADHFFRWTMARSLPLTVVNEATVKRFLFTHLPRCRCPKPRYKDPTDCRLALRQLFLFLRQQQLIQPPPYPKPSAIDQLISAYDRHLSEVAGLTEGTRRGYRIYARQFLCWRFGRRPVRLQKLVPSDITRFVAQRSSELKPPTLRGLAATLRSFLQYLHFIGQGDARLTGAVTCPPPWPHSPVPETLSKTQLRTFLKSFDRKKPMGRRDFAIALCLCRLGLRALEVASLRLEDVDWRARTLHLRQTKLRRGRVLPLPPDVAKALRDYLQLGRPATHCTAVFVRHRAPLGEGQRSELVRAAMRDAFARCGWNHVRVHILRHTLATQLHRQGLNIKTIADLLGHQSLDTTARYARVNFDELRQAALPWPNTWR